MSRKLASLASGVKSIFGKKSRSIVIPKTVKKKACGICRCSCALMLPTTLEALHKDTEEQAASRPLDCWVRGR